MVALLIDQKLLQIDGVWLKVHKDYDPNTYKDCDGCGSGWSEPLVPDKIYFKSILSACCPHDFRYGLGGSEEDKRIADEEFLYNMMAIIEAYGKKRWIYPTKLARARAMLYYSMVNDSDLAMEKFMANNKAKGEEDGDDACETDTLGAADDRGSNTGEGERWCAHRQYRVFRSKSKRGV